MVVLPASTGLCLDDRHASHGVRGVLVSYVSSLASSTPVAAGRWSFFASPHAISVLALILRAPGLRIYLVGCALHTLFKNPSFCANRFNASSLSARLRTNPHSAYTWFSPVYRPFSSTLPTEIWTEAWSLALMMRLVALHLRGT